MTANPVLILAFVAVILVGLLVLRSSPRQVRTTFSIIFFAAISAFLFRQGVSPLFTPPKGQLSALSLLLRLMGGLWWLLGANLGVAALRLILRQSEFSRETRLFSDLASAVVYVAAALIVLNSVFALPITGLLATSGVLAIVLGLALQNTLADVFAGIAVGTDGPFRIGDRITVGEKIEGVVVQANWRSVRIKTDDEDIAIIPNSSVAKSEITNRSFPSRKERISVELACPNNIAPERVIESLLQTTLLCPDIVQNPSPKAVLIRLGQRNNTYVTTFYVGDFDSTAATKSAFLHQAWRQLRYGGLLINSAGSNQVSAMASLHNSTMGLELLRDLLLFESLDDRQVEALSARLERRRLEAGEMLFKQEESDATLYIVGSGILEFSRKTSAAAAVRIGCIGAGDYVGEIGLLTGAPHGATAVARTHCVMYCLPPDAIAPLLSENPKLMSEFEKAVRRGLEILHRDVVARASETAGSKDQFLARVRAFFKI